MNTPSWFSEYPFRVYRIPARGLATTSLTVPPGLLEQAKLSEVDDAEFLDCVRTSLPYA